MQRINMKLFGAHARIISLSLTLIGYLFIGGCLYLPMPSRHWDAHGAKVKPTGIVSGITAREVLEKLGEPVVLSADGRYFLYRYWRQRRGAVAGYGGGGGGPIEYKPREVIMLIEFDRTNTVRRKRTHTCETRAFDPVCDSAMPLCEMLKELKDDTLLATYC